jgi:hypothetical protein
MSHALPSAVATRRRNRVLHRGSRCHTRLIQPTRPRYSVTGTGRTAALLDLAERAWPDVGDRKELLLRLAEAGAGVAELAPQDRESARAARRQDLLRSRKLLGSDALLSDQAWA